MGDVYEYAAQIQEVNRYLSAASGGNIALEDLYLRADGRVGGLPEKVEKLLYETKNNMLSDHMTYKTADKYDYYKYRFDRVL